MNRRCPNPLASRRRLAGRTRSRSSLAHAAVSTIRQVPRNRCRLVISSRAHHILVCPTPNGLQASHVCACRTAGLGQYKSGTLSERPGRTPCVARDYHRRRKAVDKAIEREPPSGMKVSGRQGRIGTRRRPATSEPVTIVRGPASRCDGRAGPRARIAAAWPPSRTPGSTCRP
jgi:hypothetical protein